MRQEATEDLGSELPPGFTQMFPEARVPSTIRVRIRPVPGEGGEGQGRAGRGGHAHRGPCSATGEVLK